VPQEPRLLVDTVAANIRFLREGVSDADVERAARLAGLHDEIAARPEGYATLVGPRGEGFSGGQRQRMCIARALVRKPDVIIFDEPTSALDVHAEAVVQEALARLKGTATLFIIAHRLSTLRVCDRVMVLQEGRLQSFASSEELARNEGYFADALRLAQL
jgi:ABC-type multidrug transport system fused ATPase/permease subunit